MGWPQSVALPDELQLGKLIERTPRAHRALCGAAIARRAVGAAGAQTFGEIRAVGANAAARFAGMPVAAPR